MVIGHWTFTGHWTLGIGHYLSPSWLVGLLEFRHCHLHLDRGWLVLRLLENFDHPFAALDLGLGLRIEVRPKLRKRGQLPELRQLKLDPAGDLFHGFDLRGRTDPRNRQTDRDGWP